MYLYDLEDCLTYLKSKVTALSNDTKLKNVLCEHFGKDVIKKELRIVRTVIDILQTIQQLAGKHINKKLIDERLKENGN